ncbi:hypothetical protein PIB30_011954 [Stylosanthes scabra]|uniref:Core Histone H2A/H2B/H3 domain-containing protein n=1 Tax=Stylosanthes scabra TaxID=79078 RepID=A0ABU6W9J7_9FABA|nr:hypothetical protein [Stylosanthes scabra]
MAPKRGQKVVVTSSRKVVEESVQVSIVGSSSKRTTRGNNNKDILTGEEVVGEESVRTIPVQEVTPQQNDKGEQEHTPNIETGEQKIDTAATTVSHKEEPKELLSKQHDEKKAKTHEGNDGKGKNKKRRKRSSGEGYKRYVYMVLKQVHPDMGISSQAMTVLNNLMSDMFERLADEASKLKTYTGHMTLSSREIQGAVKLVLPGELGKHAIAEGAKAVTNYMSHDA